MGIDNLKTWQEEAYSDQDTSPEEEVVALASIIEDALRGVGVASIDALFEGDESGPSVDNVIFLGKSGDRVKADCKIDIPSAVSDRYPGISGCVDIERGVEALIYLFLDRYLTGWFELEGGEGAFSWSLSKSEAQITFASFDEPDMGFGVDLDMRSLTCEAFFVDAG